jgi:hypothetical protein
MTPTSNTLLQAAAKKRNRLIYLMSHPFFDRAVLIVMAVSLTPLVATLCLTSQILAVAVGYSPHRLSVGKADHLTNLGEFARKRMGKP